MISFKKSRVIVLYDSSESIFWAKQNYRDSNHIHICYREEEWGDVKYARHMGIFKLVKLVYTLM